MRHNFPYRNLLIFKLDLEEKIWESRSIFEFRKQTKIARNGLKIQEFV
jgi:hypothetical protein